VKYGGNIEAAAAVGKRIAERRKLLASKRLRLIAAVIGITAASRRWRKRRVNTD
jgi:hypothetical protein